MYVTHDEYKSLEYAVVPEAEFDRYEAMAEATVRNYTQNRITDEDLHPDKSDLEAVRVAEMNQRGMCEIINAYYMGNNPNSEAAKARQVLTGFKNREYSETYLGRANVTEAQSAIPERMDIFTIVNTYFTQDQLCRGVS